jgi:hypothetical protein
VNEVENKKKGGNEVDDKWVEEKRREMREMTSKRGTSYVDDKRMVNEVGYKRKENEVDD